MSAGEPITWRQTDETDWLSNCPDHVRMTLIYGRIYTAGENYKFSETNQQILNLKKSVTASRQELFYKRQAIEHFSKEASDFLLGKQPLPLGQRLLIIPMPPSKTKSHPDYDDRMEQVAELVAKKLGDRGIYFPILYTVQNREGAHRNTGERKPNLIYQCLAVDETYTGQYAPGDLLIVIDDVLTSGAHFSAAHQKLQECFPNANIVGLFWAKTERPENFQPPV